MSGYDVLMAIYDKESDKLVYFQNTPEFTPMKVNYLLNFGNSQIEEYKNGALT